MFSTVVIGKQEERGSFVDRGESLNTKSWKHPLYCSALWKPVLSGWCDNLEALRQSELLHFRAKNLLGMDFLYDP